MLNGDQGLNIHELTKVLNTYDIANTQEAHVTHHNQKVLIKLPVGATSSGFRRPLPNKYMKSGAAQPANWWAIGMTRSTWAWNPQVELLYVVGPKHTLVVYEKGYLNGVYPRIPIILLFCLYSILCVLAYSMHFLKSLAECVSDRFNKPSNASILIQPVQGFCPISPGSLAW